MFPMLELIFGFSLICAFDYTVLLSEKKKTKKWAQDTQDDCEKENILEVCSLKESGIEALMKLMTDISWSP